MKKVIVFLLSGFMLLCLSAAAEIDIVCSLFPQYDFTRHIAGERANVMKLLPHGVDSHDYEPSARDMVKCAEADMFIFTDEHLEGWISSLSACLDGVHMVRCAEGIDLEALQEEWESISEHDHEHEHETASHMHTYDAHIWLDLTLSEIMCENICAALSAYDPEGADYYEANLNAYLMELRALDAEFDALFHEYHESRLYFGGKFAYSHFLRRYGVQFESAYATCSDEGEPGIRTIIHMVDEMKETGAKVIFTDEMSSGEIARAIAAQTGAETKLFHTAHNLSARDAEKGLTFIDVMRMNLANIESALGHAEGEHE